MIISSDRQAAGVAPLRRRRIEQLRGGNHVEKVVSAGDQHHSILEQIRRVGINAGLHRAGRGPSDADIRGPLRERAAGENAGGDKNEDNDSLPKVGCDRGHKDIWVILRRQ